MIVIFFFFKKKNCLNVIQMKHVVNFLYYSVLKKSVVLCYVENCQIVEAHQNIGNGYF